MEEEEEEVVAVGSSLPFVSNLRFLFPVDDDGDFLTRCGDERGEEDGEEPSSPSSPSSALCLRVEDMV